MLSTVSKYSLKEETSFVEDWQWLPGSAVPSARVDMGILCLGWHADVHVYVITYFQTDAEQVNNVKHY